MAKINQGILGGFSGKVGPVIGGSWKGIPYFRSKPGKYSFNPSQEQSIHRNKFVAAIALAKTVHKTIIKPIWDQKAVKMSGFNLFVKTNKNVFDETGTLSDFANLKFSVGNLLLPENIVVTTDVSGNGLFLISWTFRKKFDNDDPTDTLCLVTTNGNDPIVMKSLNFSREASSAAVQLPYGPGETVHVYVFFCDVMLANFSNCFYTRVDIPSTTSS
jgi:hypothetical protein